MRLNKTDRVSKKAQYFDSTNGKSEIVNHSQKMKLPQTNYLWHFKLFGETINDKENWSSNLLDTCQKDQLKRLTNKARGSQFRHLFKRMLRETSASFHTWASPKLKLYYYPGSYFNSKALMIENLKFVLK